MNTNNKIKMINNMFIQKLPYQKHKKEIIHGTTPTSNVLTENTNFISLLIIITRIDNAAEYATIRARLADSNSQ